MAYAPHRSMNADLSEGMTDGKYKKVVTDRGGFVEPTTYEDRKDLFPFLYGGIYEETNKVRPDAKIVSTPNTVATPKPPNVNW